MALASNVERVRQHLYGSGLYEKPVIIQLANTGNTGISTGVQTLTMVSTANVKRGSVLSTFDGDVNNAFAAYVLDVPSATTLTVLFGYHGSPAPASDNLQGYLFEHNPKFTEWEIHQAIAAIVNGHLWPELFEFDTGTIATPDFSTFQTEMPADVERIISAHQVVAGVAKPVSFSLDKHVHTAISSTGNLARFGYVDQSALYYTYIRRLVELDTQPWLPELVTLGAAAMLMDSGMPPTTMPYRANVVDISPQQAAAEAMWRSYMQLRELARLDLSREHERFEIVH